MMVFQNKAKFLLLVPALIVVALPYHYLYHTELRQTPHQQASPGQQQIFLVTRGRSGSSFTSELIRHHPQVFFLFEPLQRLDDWFVLRSPQQVREDHKKGVVGFNIWGDSKRREAVERMDEFFQCDLTNVSAINIPAFRHRNDTMDMTRCLDDKKMSGWQHLQCYLDMVASCRHRSVVFAKSIRFRMQWTEQLLRKHPNFKVIFLIRDPRAVLRSQARVWRDWFNFQNDIVPVATTYCRELGVDLRHFRRLEQLFPARLKLVRYEDGARDPLQYTRDLYRFLDLEVTPRTESHVQALTSSTDTTSGNMLPAFRVYRKDPVATSTAWRKQSSFKTISVIDKHCGKLYPFLGYRKIESQKDLNSNRTVLLKPKW